MNTKYCPACGHERCSDGGVCAHCGLEGLDQIFLSEEAYQNWADNVLVPHQNRFLAPQLFCFGPSGLVLLRSGDLYAVGDNRSGIFGPDLPDDLEQPTRIARNVTHAAMTAQNTMYVTKDGAVHVTGDNALAERFSFSQPVSRVYARKDMHYLVTEDGSWFVCGYNDAGSYPVVSRTREVLREYPQETVRNTRSYLANVNWNSGGQEYLYSYGSDTGCSFDWESVRRSEWFRDLVRTHGEANIITENLRIDHSIRTLDSSYGERTGDYYNVYEKDEILDVYQPRVLLENREIYQPVPCEALFDRKAVSDKAPRYLEGSIPLEKPRSFPQFYRDARKIIFTSYTWDFCGLFAPGAVLFLHRGDSVMKMHYPPLRGVTDFVWDWSHSHILAVTGDGQVILGSQWDAKKRKSWDGARRWTLCEGARWPLYGEE